MSLKLSATYKIQTQTTPIDLEPGFRESQGAKSEPSSEPSRPPQQAYPLGMVLEACPDIVDYAKGGISNWRDFLCVAAVVRSMLGISPSAWEAAQIGHGRTSRRDRRRGDPAKGRGDCQRRRVLARTHPKSRGRRIHARTDADGADRKPKTGQETGVACRWR